MAELGKEYSRVQISHTLLNQIVSLLLLNNREERFWGQINF